MIHVVPTTSWKPDYNNKRMGEVQVRNMYCSWISTLWEWLIKFGSCSIRAMRNLLLETFEYLSLARIQGETFKPSEKFNLFKCNWFDCRLFGELLLLHISSLGIGHMRVGYVAWRGIFPGGAPFPGGDKAGDSRQKQLSPPTYLAHKLVDALSPLQNQVVLGWEGVVMGSTFHSVKVLPVFYLKETHKEGPELCLHAPGQWSLQNYPTLKVNIYFREFSEGKKNHMFFFFSIKSTNHSAPFILKCYWLCSHLHSNFAWRKILKQSQRWALGFNIIPYLPRKGKERNGSFISPWGKSAPFWVTGFSNWIVTG